MEWKALFVTEGKDTEQMKFDLLRGQYKYTYDRFSGSHTPLLRVYTTALRKHGAVKLVTGLDHSK
jgi:hypothetical protein